MRRNLVSGVLAAAVAALAAIPTARAELEISAYTGYSESFSSDVTVTEGGTSTTFRNVDWSEENFSAPIYYGVRAGWWFDPRSNWGVAVDFTHAKVKADPPPPPLRRLEFTHGYNLLTANALYRYRTDTRLTPYLGLGAGVAILHVEVDTGASRTFEYQVAGFAVQGLIGVDYRVWRGLSVFGEDKVSYSSNNADLTGGGTLETEIWTNHLVFGLRYRF